MRLVYQLHCGQVALLKAMSAEIFTFARQVRRSCWAQQACARCPQCLAHSGSVTAVPWNSIALEMLAHFRPLSGLVAATAGAAGFAVAYNVSKAKPAILIFEGCACEATRWLGVGAGGWHNCFS